MDVLAKLSCKTNIGNTIFQYHSFWHSVRKANSDNLLSKTSSEQRKLGQDRPKGG